MVALGLGSAMVLVVIVEKNIWAPAWLAVKPSKSLHQSYQQFDAIVDLASDGRRGGVYEGIEAVKFAELVKATEVVKFLETGELPDVIKLVEADELVGFVRLGKKEVLTLVRELEVSQSGTRWLLSEVKEVVSGGTGWDWAVGPTVTEELNFHYLRYPDT